MIKEPRVVNQSLVSPCSRRLRRLGRDYIGIVLCISHHGGTCRMKAVIGASQADNTYKEWPSRGVLANKGRVVERLGTRSEQ